MLNVNDLGYGYCPLCKEWKELTRYHPRDKDLSRRQKNKYCVKCIQKVVESRKPFYSIRKAISVHKLKNKEGDYTFKDIMELRNLQGGVCAYCSKALPYDFSLDHIVPTKFGGRNVFSNIVLTCNKCNSAKQHFELFFFLRRKKFKLNPHIMKKVKGAFDYHDYECKGSCKDCKASCYEKKSFCEDCPFNELSQKRGKSTIATASSG